MKALLFLIAILTRPDFSHLPTYKAQFYNNTFDYAWYTYYKWDVPVHITLAVAAIETNYGRNKKMINRGDYFGTGLDYSEKINPFDEFGLKMATYWREKEFYLVEYIGNKKQIIQISKIIKEITNVTLPEQREKIAHRCSY